MAVEILTEKNFKESICSEKITIVDFWADWCGPCKVLAPILDSLADKYEGTLVVSKLNVTDNIDIAKEYSVSSIPCLIVFRAGKEIDRSVGFKGHEELEELFNKHSGS